MFIGYLKVGIFIPHSRSLKDKRRVISRLKQRVRNNFNVSLAEKPSDKWQISELCFVCVNYTHECVHQLMSKIEEFIRLHRDIQIVDTDRRII